MDFDYYHFGTPLSVAVMSLTYPNGDPMPDGEGGGFRNPDPGAELATVQALLQYGAGATLAPSKQSKPKPNLCPTYSTLCEGRTVLASRAAPVVVRQTAYALRRNPTSFGLTSLTPSVADPDPVDEQGQTEGGQQGRTPLGEVCKGRCVAVVVALLDAGADIERRQPPTGRAARIECPGRRGGKNKHWTDVESTDRINASVSFILIES